MLDDLTYENEIRKLLGLFSLEEVLEMLDITPERVLEILLIEGHCNLIRVPFLQGLENTDEKVDSSND